MTTSYTVVDNLQLKLEAAKNWSQFTNRGGFYKLSVVDQRSYGLYSFGWKTMLAYNDQYFIANSDFSHVLGRVWVSYQLNPAMALGLEVGKQIGLMDQFADPDWVNGSLTYGF